ncbi:DUF484 family protein [Aquabacterium sp.]|uniref:DUF484 family protein n=1 Tax=Aquabacterium sp. TaxID=1872578 RepID=UPI002C10127C|nr:DUF484 family protein [Aquabacterium sp.]HSW05608.1 DUF484 family protein [Aquabacterium sp.]
MTLQGAITETDIANYLANTPGFFERHAELLSTIQLTSPHGHRAVSLQERQMEMMREKVKGLEQKIMEMIRHGQENVAIADRLQRWIRAILLTPSAAALPDVLVSTLKHEFLIPLAALRLWGVDAAFAALPFAQGVADDTRSFASSLVLPYCGVNSGFEASSWLGDSAPAMSVALIPLYRPSQDEAFGLLVLGSPDPTRYTAEMGTEFLQRIGEIAGAGLSRLLPQG